MNDRKMSRRTALTLTAAAATGAAILADAKPALATWPTITSPDGGNGLADSTRRDKKGHIFKTPGALSAAHKAISEMRAGKPATTKFQDTTITSWRQIEQIFLAAALAVNDLAEKSEEWTWKPSKAPHPPHPPKH